MSIVFCAECCEVFESNGVTVDNAAVCPHCGAISYFMEDQCSSAKSVETTWSEQEPWSAAKEDQSK